MHIKTLAIAVLRAFVQLSRPSAQTILLSASAFNSCSGMHFEMIESSASQVTKVETLAGTGGCYQMRQHSSEMSSNGRKIKPSLQRSDMISNAVNNGQAARESGAGADTNAAEFCRIKGAERERMLQKWACN